MHTTRTVHVFWPGVAELGWLGRFTRIAMKRILILVLVVISFTSLLLAQGWFWSGGRGPHVFVDHKKPPPLSVPDAYALALAHLGPDTNRLWCVSASCDADYGQTTMTHWLFNFANSNREITKVRVSFDRKAQRL
jgi:hypothetical protein